MGRKRKIKPPPRNEELNKLEGELNKIEGKGEIDKSVKKEQDNEIQKDKTAENFMASPFYAKLMERKDEMVLNLILKPSDNFNHYFSIKYPDKKSDIEKICTFTDKEKAELKYWSNILVDLYAPDFAKYYKLILTIIGLGTIVSMYGGMYLRLRDVTKPIEEKKKPEHKKDDSKK